MKRLAVVFYNVGGHEMTKHAIDCAKMNSNPDTTSIVLVDNGSTEPYPRTWLKDRSVDRIVRYEKTLGPNYLFHLWDPCKDDWWLNDRNCFKKSSNPVRVKTFIEPGEYPASDHGSEPVPEFIAFLHADLFVYEKGWDKRVLEAFDADPKLGLIGFVGSNEIDSSGGRGSGTVLNFQGRDTPFGKASYAEQHGRRSTQLEAAAVLDGCVMVFRTSVLKELTPWVDRDPPFHFYDRVLSCEVIEKGYRVAYLGIQIDHLNGGIRGGTKEADEMRQAWVDKYNVPLSPHGLDHTVYREAEQLFFRKYRDTKFFPLKVNKDYSVVRR